MNGFSINRTCYALASADGVTAEITMYGDVVESWPTDWWTGERIEGNFICQDEFLADLDRVKKCKNVSIRMNSYGGDTAVGFLIHNRLRELAADGVKLTCIVDGVAMSAASVIMCACDTVRINPASLVMVHKCWSLICGGYNADKLRKQAEAQDAYDKAIVSAYKRKCGLSETVIMHMMSEETYLTGREAVEKGFADELIEDAQPLNIAASSKRDAFIVNGRVHICAGAKIPDTIPTVIPAVKAVVTKDKTMPVTAGEEGEKPMDITELRAQYPELVAEVENSARAGTSEAIAEAEQAERDRIRAIDEVASLFDAQLVNDAKYGDNRCTAAELAYRAAQNAAKRGRRFLADLEQDSIDSGAAGVTPAPAPNDPETEVDMMAQARAQITSLLGAKEG